MTQNNYITQSVYFHEGPFDGKVATLAIPKPFVGGMVLDIEGRKYKVTNGPTAMIVERTQATFEQGALRVAYQPPDVLAENKPIEGEL
jgi:hypothetical protein